MAATAGLEGLVRLNSYLAPLCSSMGPFALHVATWASSQHGGLGVVARHLAS